MLSSVGLKLPRSKVSSEATNDKALINQQSPKYFDYLTSLLSAPPSKNNGIASLY
jgi:hypothetical protein